MRKFLFRFKHLQQPLEKTLFPVLLFLWPLVSCLQGVSVTDPSYSLGNYIHLFRMGEGSTWLFATYLANCAGALLMKLPFGAAMPAMNIKTALLISITALAAYKVLHRMIPGWMLFIGEWLAESLFWCPTVILYNTLTSLLLVLAVLFLFIAVSDTEHESRWYVLAGICLGLNIFVRFSNAVHVLLILPVWYHAAAAARSGRERSGSVRRVTLLCLAGFAAGVAAGFICIFVRYSPSAYFGMIRSLLGLGNEASSYTLGGMLSATAAAYWTAVRNLIWLIPLMICGFFLYRFPLFDFLNRGKGTGYRVHALLYLAAVLLMFRLYYGQGIFTVNYADYWCMFEWGMFFVIMAAVLSVWMLIGMRDAQSEEKFLAVTVLVLILILPLGSNNYTFPVIGNLFVIAPVALWFLRRIWKRYHHRAERFVVFGLAFCMIAALLIQGTLFHLRFAFGDGTDGTARSYVVRNGGPAAGMHTVPENGAALDGLYEWLHDDPEGQEILGGKVVTLGNIPGVIYYCGLEPALSNLWPDLESFPQAEFAGELDALEEAPAVILPAEAAKAPVQYGSRQFLLQTYMDSHRYRTVYENAYYVVRKAGR